MIRALVAALLLASAVPALAEPWVWTDETGEDVFTDDPSLVPEAQRHTLRRFGEEAAAEDDAEEGGWYSGVTVDDRELTAEERAEAARRTQQRQSLVREVERLSAEIDALERERLQADNEHRRYKVGGRIGAADKAAAAKAKLDAIDRRLAALRSEAARAEAGLSLAD